MKEQDISKTQQTELPGSAKRPWKTPTLAEEDYQETRASLSGTGVDGGIYS